MQCLSDLAPICPAAFWIALTLGTMVPATAQTDSPIKVISDSPLPAGDGFAAEFSRDQDIANHSAVIFSDDFESGELGAKWDDTSNRGDSLAYVHESASQTSQNPSLLGERSLKVTATLGENTGGGFTKWFESADRLFIRFYTKFDKDCDYVHHFCTLRANKSLQGGDRWSGFGGAGELPDGDERFSTAIEPWGNWGRWPPPGRWNFYSYWHTMNESPDGKYWGNGFRPESQPNIQRGSWICVEFMIRHNTPGQNDGEQAFWIDGELRGHWKGFNWRTSPTLFANALTLESYVTDRWTKQSENVVYFDNVVIAKEYIGPSGKDG
ncbi:hypothetical protein FYK55_23495 [Roseiconus nitratireducens]|uniref:Polysaccharide lyase-like protein n=1 Tax=Roseiconus nitratireducens TaxID=2605748 RepID=A0A5M6D3K3_9BACT|nr:hypothetical protein [Roseiconus nitratireducens]KAA5539765.1 hypothetical protein FYK55_23495 [Roseiconus nitratireducens]